MMFRETWAEIDLSALKHNYNRIKNATGVSIFPVVKANAYGHGDIEVSKFLETLDAPLLCVSSIHEAIHLQNNGITTDILIFSYVNPEVILETKSFNFIYTVPNVQWIERVESLGLSLRLHLEYNGGMNRYGIHDLITIQEIGRKHTLEGVYMHFQKAENTLKTKNQLEGFKSIIDNLAQIPQWIHVGNASLEIFKQNPWINGFRVGLGLYGYRDDMDLTPVLSLYTKVTHIDYLLTNETVGYDYDYHVQDAGYYGTIPIGYADGFVRKNRNLPVWINEKPYTIVGKICMDQTMVQLDDSVDFLDSVELIGKHRTLSSLVDATGFSAYEILTGLSERIKRDYN